MKYTVGIDEVGRGPLAGPVTVCAVQWLSDEPPDAFLSGIRDSKKLSAAKRLSWAEYAVTLGRMLRYQVCSVDARVIDEAGISQALYRAADRALIGLHDVSHVYSDYGLPLPDVYTATHIIKGDEQHPLIALASIVAKVTRDAAMVNLSEQFPVYGFERNKGYGTQEHRDAVCTHGACPAHRQSFLGNILGQSSASSV